MAAYTQKERNGMYELTDVARAELVSSKYYNKDLAPTSISERTWNTYHISMLWVGMSICIPSFMMASGMVGMGLTPWMAVLNVILGNVIILVPIQLNSHAGTKYGIPFPVFSRLTFGLRGAHLPSVSRAITACGWNMVQSLTGGAALLFMLYAILSSNSAIGETAQLMSNSGVPAAGSGEFALAIVAFLVFLFISGLLTAKGSRVIQVFESIGSPILIVLSIALLIWAIMLGSGAGYSFGEIAGSNISATGIDNATTYLFVFLGGLTGNISFWATMALNIPDFSRYAKDQKAQFRGQLYGMPLAMAFCAIVGAVYAQSTFLALGTPYFSPVAALGELGNTGGLRVVTFLVGLGVVIATLTTNIAANIVAPANGISNLAPRRISYVGGTIIACVVAIIYFIPYALSATFSGFVFTFMNVYGGILGPVAAIFIADYYIIKKRNIDVMALFKDGAASRYWYESGFNSKALIAWFCGAIIPTLASLIPAFAAIPVIAWINANSYLFAFFVALLVYVAIMPRTHSSFISDEQEAAMTER